jgi:hypothetical protein
LGDKNEIRKPMHYHAPVAFFDDVRQHSESGRETGVAVGEDVRIRAFSPVYIDWRVYGFLDIRAVKVER